LIAAIAYIAAMAVLLITRDKKTLFKPGFKTKFYPLYGMVHFKAVNFAVLMPLGKKLILGLFIGLLQTSSKAQLSICLIFFVGYLVLLILLKPFFADYLQTYLEIFLTVINILTIVFLFPLGVRTDLSGHAQIGLTVIFMVLHMLGLAACLVMFIAIWVQQREVYTFAQCKDLFLGWNIIVLKWNYCRLRGCYSYKLRFWLRV